VKLASVLEGKPTMVTRAVKASAGVAAAEETAGPTSDENLVPASAREAESAPTDASNSANGASETALSPEEAALVLAVVEAHETTQVYFASMLQHVYLVGGCADIPGFPASLSRELGALAAALNEATGATTKPALEAVTKQPSLATLAVPPPRVMLPQALPDHSKDGGLSGLCLRGAAFAGLLAYDLGQRKAAAMIMGDSRITQTHWQQAGRRAIAERVPFLYYNTPAVDSAARPFDA
jgi:hypothetical protein